jgi:glycerol-3-phosphate dehydrogenase
MNTDGGSFGAAARAEGWRRLGEEVYDLLVIGAGITGCGIARDAGCRGLRVALVDAQDLAGGTSSRSSRLVHGGLRYLETFDFDLVFEALRERRRLLELAPHLVRPLPFLFPVFRGDPTGLLKLGAGMWLYDTLSLFRSPRRHRMLGVNGTLQQEPRLRTDGLLGAALYYDAQVDDARLTLAIARGAREAGADVVSYASVRSIRFAPDSPAHVGVRDELTGREVGVRARVVLNAAGPWSDAVRQIADPAVSPRLRPTKGVHLLFDRQRVGNRQALIFRSGVDGRVMFVLPWGTHTYVGTTDTEYSGDPGTAEADDADITYLLDSVNRIFPSAKLSEGDVISTWAGVRPLLSSEYEADLSASATSREHAIWRDGRGLVNIAGGKLTTYRSMAAEAVDRVSRILLEEWRVESGSCYTEFLPLPGAPEEDWDTFVWQFGREADRLALPAGAATHIAERYGADAAALLERVARDPSLGKPILPGFPYLWVDVAHAAREEMALTLEDVLRRRLQLFYLARDGGLSIAARVATCMAEAVGLEGGAQVEEQVAVYEAAVRRTRRLG